MPYASALLRHALVGIAIFVSPLTGCSVMPDESLEGVWFAHEVLSPTFSGALAMTQNGGTWQAEVAGTTIEGTPNGDWIEFAFEGGTLRLAGSATPLAFWLQPERLANETTYATPVPLTPTSDGWRGEITPLADEFTLYLVVGGNDEEPNIFFRNPECNIGIYFRLSAFEAVDDALTLTGRLRWEDEPYAIATGQRTSAGAFILDIPALEQAFRFTRLDLAEPSDFFPGGTPEAPYSYAAPRARDDGWPVADAADVGIDPAGLEGLVAAIHSIAQGGIGATYPHAILVARHGQLVFEQYFHGNAADIPHDTRSSSKSFSTTMIGVMMEAGAALRPSDSVFAILGEPVTRDPRSAALTVEHLMTMSSGLNCDDNDDSTPGNEDVMQSQNDEPDWHRYTLDLSFVRDPGAEAVYCSAGINLLSAVLASATGTWVPFLVDEHFARPLQFGTYHMNLTPSGEAYFGGGLRATARDFMKLGQLMLNDGVWNDMRVLPVGWAAAATAPYYPMNNQHYGYGWWLIDYPYEDGHVSAFYSGGNGGQMVINVPELDLVVMVNAGNYGDFGNLLALRDDYVGRYIIPAVARD